MQIKSLVERNIIMEAYSDFAYVYDMFMDNIPYDEWIAYILKLLKENDITEGVLLELGCGTGNIASRLDQAGFEMIAVDNSLDMLSIAREKTIDQDILYLHQDMREIELFDTVSAIISVCDTMNYILDYEDLLIVFKLAYKYLETNGVFIFDLDTIYQYKEILGDRTIAEVREEGSFIWENTYYEEEQINEIDLSLFIPEGDTMHRKHEEIHQRRAYDLTIVTALMEEAGLKVEGVYDNLSKNPPNAESERVYIIGKKE